MWHNITFLFALNTFSGYTTILLSSLVTLPLFFHWLHVSFSSSCPHVSAHSIFHPGSLLIPSIFHSLTFYSGLSLIFFPPHLFPISVYYMPLQLSSNLLTFLPVSSKEDFPNSNTCSKLSPMFHCCAARPVMEFYPNGIIIYKIHNRCCK